MADDDAAQPSLEPPRLFGRKKAKAPRSAPRSASGAEVSALPTTDPEPVGVPTPEPEPEPEPAPVAQTSAPYQEMLPAEPEPAADTATTKVHPPAEGDVETVARQASPSASTDVSPTPGVSEDDAPQKDKKKTKEKREKKEKKSSGPLLHVSERLRAAIAGLATGVVLIGLTFAGFGVCETVQGTSSCGTVAGSGLLIVVLILAVLAGKYLLAAFKMPDPGSTSFLAVGLMGIVVLLFFVDQLDTAPVLVGLPLLTSATFVASWWVTTTYVEPADHG